MSVVDGLSNFVVGRGVFPCTNYLYNRKNILGTYRRMLKLEREPREAVRKLQLDRLKRVIGFAERRVPLYAKRFREIGFSAGDLKSLDDISKLPTLEREDLVERHTELVDERCSESMKASIANTHRTGEPIPFAVFRKNKLVRNTSRGSTGDPTVSYEDGSIAAYSWANELRIRHWFGLPLGVREGRMSGISTSYTPGSRTLKLRQLLWHQSVFPGMNLDEEDFAVALEQFKRFRPRVIWGIASALSGLAEHVLSTGKDIAPLKPELVITWAAPLHDHERRVLSKVFDCPLSNIYGSREVGHVAGMCPEGSLHLHEETALIEIDKSTEAENPEDGDVLVTTLMDTPMPLIRYRIGDVASISEEPCACGRSLRVMSPILGRSGEYFRAPDGRMLSPNFWVRFFMDPGMSDSIKRFQVVYTDKNRFRVRIQRADTYTDEIDAHLRKRLDDNMKGSMQFELDYVKKVEPLASGKYCVVVNEVGREA